MRKLIIDGIEFEDFEPVRKSLKKFIFNPFINYVLPPSFLKNVFINSKSDLAKESIAAPGSWLSMKYCYENLPAKDIVDALVLKYASFPVGLRNRKKLCVSEIAKLIKRYEHRDKIVLVGIGAGLGVNAMEAIKHAESDKVEAYFFDLDDKVIKPANEVAGHLGLSDKVKFIQADAVDMKDYIPQDANILKLIGILEYLDDETVLKLLKTGYDNLSHDGSLITHSIEPAHGVDPFLKKVFNLNLYYRTPEKMISMLKESGFEILDIKKEPLNIYNIIPAVKR